MLQEPARVGVTPLPVITVGKRDISNGFAKKIDQSNQGSLKQVKTMAHKFVLYTPAIKIEGGELNSFSTEAGVYIDLTVNNLPGKFVVDTGATVSLISKRLFYAIPTVERPALSQIRQTVLSTNGTALPKKEKVFSLFS